MQTFTVLVEYNGKQCDCFVQMFSNEGENVCIVNFCNNDLIKLYRGKRMVIAAPANMDADKAYSTVDKKKAMQELVLRELNAQMKAAS
ncbi:MAG: hypothetical protein J0I41_02385 [Filimonas sp.]|nr:hypothetical protein [Filimonas sp.]